MRRIHSKVQATSGADDGHRPTTVPASRRGGTNCTKQDDSCEGQLEGSVRVDPKGGPQEPAEGPRPYGLGAMRSDHAVEPVHHQCSSTKPIPRSKLRSSTYALLHSMMAHASMQKILQTLKVTKGIGVRRDQLEDFYCTSIAGHVS